MDDKVDTESGGVAAKMMLAHIDKFFACAQEKYTEYGLHECWAPVGGSSELLNPELALHFKGKPWIQIEAKSKVRIKPKWTDTERAKFDAPHWIILQV